MVIANKNGKITTSNKQFLHFADKSALGILLIQKGYLKYFNKSFLEIFGYSKEEVQQWKKREFYKIVHPNDLANLTQQLRIEENNVVTVRFRGIRKDGQIIPIENYICVVSHNDKKAMLCSYLLLDKPMIRKGCKKIKIEINLPEKYNKYFEYIEFYFGLKRKEYIENVIKKEIDSRNFDLKIF